MALRVLGICGGMACGKSTRVKHIMKWWEQTGTQEFPSLHVVQADADKVGHRCYVPGTKCYHEVVAHFGNEILEAERNEDQTEQAQLPQIDRKKLGALVFGTGRMPELNKIVWPHIALEVQAEVSQAVAQQLTQGASIQESSIQEQVQEHEREQMKKSLVFVIEAAILPHMSEMLELCSDVWLFHVKEEDAVRRVVQRNSVSAEEALRRIRTQSSVEEKQALISAAKKRLRVFDTSNTDTEDSFQATLTEALGEFKALLKETQKM